MYLLDTDTISHLVRKQPPARLLARMAIESPELQYTSSITLGELMYGAFRRPERTESLLARLETALPPRSRILSFGYDAARSYASLRALLEAGGNAIGDADMRIAAVALVHGFVVVTGNTRHFERVPGLSIENWLV